jgi:glycogen debranching enzyme
MIYNRFADLLHDDTACFEELAMQVKKSFRLFFLNEKGYLNDVVVPGQSPDARFRPNQIYALSLPFPLLDEAEGRRVLSLIEEKLLTPSGLRSLDPADPDFIARYGGDQWHRDTAYHQGTVWSFLLGEYWLAYLRLHGFSQKAKAEVRRMMQPLERHFYESDCLHGISEIFDGGEPGEGRGCVHQAWSAGMTLLVLAEMERHELAHKSLKKKRLKAIQPSQAAP